MFSTAGEPAIRPLTPLSRPAPARLTRHLQNARTPSTALTSTRTASLIRGAFHRQVLPLLTQREPATVSTACKRWISFRRSCFSAVRSSAVFRNSHPVKRMDQAPLVNFCNRYEMRAQQPIVQTPHHCERQGPFSGALPTEISRARSLRSKPRAASVHRDHSRGTAYPNSIRSSTSCHNAVSVAGGERLQRRYAPCRAYPHRCLGGLHPFRTRFTPLLREEER